MNALSQIVADPIETAIAEADGWVRVATPIIKAWFALDAIDGDLRSAAYDFRGNVRWNAPQLYEESTMIEARDELRKPTANLYALIEAIRQNAIDEVMPRQPTGQASQAQWDTYDDAYEAYDARVSRGVITVDAAVKAVGDAL